MDVSIERKRKKNAVLKEVLDQVQLGVMVTMMINMLVGSNSVYGAGN